MILLPFLPAAPKNTVVQLPVEVLLLLGFSCGHTRAQYCCLHKHRQFAALHFPQVPLLSGLSAAQISALCGVLKPVIAEPKQVLISAGGPETFYVVEDGTCVVISAGGQVGLLWGLSSGSRDAPVCQRIKILHVLQINKDFFSSTASAMISKFTSPWTWCQQPWQLICFTSGTGL